MAALLILFLFGLYLWITYKLVRRARPAWAKVLIVLAAILIPTADAVYGRMKLRQMCEAEGGLHIYKTIERVEGFMDSNRPDKWWIETHGYKFVEGTNLKQSYTRISVGPDGKIITEDDTTPRSKYQVKFRSGNTKDIFMTDEMFVFNRETSEILGRVTNVSYAGGWVQRAIAGLYAARGNGGNCNLDYPEKLHESLVLKTLRPVIQGEQK